MPTLKHQFADTHKFSDTHKVEEISEGARNPNRFSLRRMNSTDWWLAVSENRPEMMYWLVCSITMM